MITITSLNKSSSIDLDQETHQSQIEVAVLLRPVPLRIIIKTSMLMGRTLHETN
jgi:hypothetical protein